MADDKTYNGWSNYETWCVKLWMDNEEGSYRYGRDMAQEAWEDAEASSTFTRHEQAAYDLAERLKSEYEEAMPEVQGVWQDLLNAAMSEVDWDEISKAMIEDEEFEDEPETEEVED